MVDVPTIKKLAKAATTKTLITFKYVDKKGEKSTRTIEPYSLKTKGGTQLLYGHDLTRDAIRAFDVTHIKNLSNTKRTFAPRWPFEFPGVENDQQREDSNR